MIKLALNGYGRIGRMVHRIALNNPDVQIVAINARSEDTKMRAHLLKHDSIHGPIQNEIIAKEGAIEVDGKDVKCLAIKDATDLPWGDMGIDVVIECTGHAKTYDIAARHIKAGSKKVVVSAPMKDDTPVYVFGINEKDYKTDQLVVSNASCTTNCIAPPIKLINEEFGIENVAVSSIHAVTHSQNLLDNSGRDLRRARSALMSIIPTTTGAVKMLGKIMPELNGKMDGIAFRVPILNSSVSDIVFHLKKDVTEDEIRNFFREKAKDPYWDPILDVTEEPLVSIDFRGNPHSTIIDLDLIKITNGRYVKLLAWYDNEWGYANRLVDLVQLVHNTK